MYLKLLDSIEKLGIDFISSSPYACESALSEYLLKFIKGGDGLDLCDCVL